MRGKALGLLWLVSIAATALSSAYILSHSERTLDDAISGLFGSLVGTLLGVGLALHLDRRKAEDERSLAQRRDEQEHAALLLHAKNALREELVHNGNAVLQLIDSVNKTPGARADAWAVARTVADSFETRAFRGLETIRRTSEEYRADEPLALFYRNLVRLQHHVRRAEAGHHVLLGYSANQAAADQELDVVRTSAAVVRSQVVRALEVLPAPDVD